MSPATTSLKSDLGVGWSEQLTTKHCLQFILDHRDPENKMRGSKRKIQRGRVASLLQVHSQTVSHVSVYVFGRQSRVLGQVEDALLEVLGVALEEEAHMILVSGWHSG